jgi:ABC-type phosphate/phosphonate transport system substrate-binding protein
MSGTHTLLMGAVAYDPKVVTIWDGFREYFAERGLDFDYVLYSNYERQVEAHLRGHIHVAWNSPLAWLQTEAVAKELGRSSEAICMRDTDRDLTSVVVVRADGAIQAVEELAGKRIAVGARDSPQACLIPLHHLAKSGLREGRDLAVTAFDVLVGKHGDHIGGERDAVEALLHGDVDAACILDSNYLGFTQQGVIPSGALRALARTSPYDHCNFTVLDDAPAEAIARFRELLLGMSYADAKVRCLLDLEGLKQWLPGRTEGYQALSAAVEDFGTLDLFVRTMTE